MACMMRWGEEKKEGKKEKEGDRGKRGGKRQKKECHSNPGELRKEGRDISFVCQRVSSNWCDELVSG